MIPAANWRLTVLGCAWLGPPGGNGFRREPDGQTSPLTQAGVVLGPVRHRVPLLGNVVTAGGIGHEGHGGIFARKPNRPLRYQTRLPTRSSMQQRASEHKGLVLWE